MSDYVDWAEQDTVVTDGLGNYGEQYVYADETGNYYEDTVLVDAQGNSYEEIDTVIS